MNAFFDDSSPHGSVGARTNFAAAMLQNEGFRLWAPAAFYDVHGISLHLDAAITVSVQCKLYSDT